MSNLGSRPRAGQKQYNPNAVLQQKPLHTSPSAGPTPAEIRQSIDTSSRLFGAVLDRPCATHYAAPGESCFPNSARHSRNACGRRLSTLSHPSNSTRKDAKR